LYAILLAYYDFGINNQEHYQLMFRNQWDKKCILSLLIVFFSTAIMYAFIHGLVELNISGHSESEKGWIVFRTTERGL